MLSTFSTKPASANCWLHSLVAGTDCGACNSRSPSSQQCIYPSIETNPVPNPYPALANIPAIQTLDPKRLINPRVNILRSGFRPIRNTRVSKLTNNYCYHLQTIHDHYPERFALSPEPRPRALHKRPHNTHARVNNRFHGYWPLQTIADHYCERFALSPEPEERPRKRGREASLKTPSEEIEERPLKRSRKTKTPRTKALPEVSEPEHEAPTSSQPTRTSQAKAKEMDKEALRLADQADRLEASADKLIADAKKLKLRARRQRKAGRASKGTNEESSELDSGSERPVPRGRGKSDSKEEVQSSRRTLRRRVTPVSYAE
ncbi:hypothetical protein VTL71DRAFT_8344 [Oculimacula yallundae]|uniref:Uncharacterized protein n=1 Tax=Oculimacula yallundae TaxID=86028 RepID=A0ABR4CZK6_9HELO